MSLMDLLTKIYPVKRTKSRYGGTYGTTQTSDPELLESMVVLTDDGDKDTWSMPQALKESNAKLIATALGWVPCRSHYHDPMDGTRSLSDLFYHSGETGFCADKIFDTLADTFSEFTFKVDYIEFEKGRPERLTGHYGYHQVTLNGKDTGKSMYDWQSAFYMALLNKGKQMAAKERA